MTVEVYGDPANLFLLAKGGDSSQEAADTIIGKGDRHDTYSEVWLQRPGTEIKAVLERLDELSGGLSGGLTAGSRATLTLMGSFSNPSPTPQGW